MESYSLQQGKAKVRCPDGFVLSILSHFKYEGCLKENKQPINRKHSVLWAPHLGCLFLRGERLDFDRRGKRQKWKALALKSLMSRFPRKDWISLLFMLFRDVWHYLKAPSQKLHKELVMLLQLHVFKMHLFPFLADLRPWHLSFPEVSFSPAQPGADASRKGSRAHSEAGIWLSPNTSAQKQTFFLFSHL